MSTDVFKTMKVGNAIRKNKIRVLCLLLVALCFLPAGCGETESISGKTQRKEESAADAGTDDIEKIPEETVSGSEITETEPDGNTDEARNENGSETKTFYFTNPLSDLKTTEFDVVFLNGRRKRLRIESDSCSFSETGPAEIRTDKTIRYGSYVLKQEEGWFLYREGNCTGQVQFLQDESRVKPLAILVKDEILEILCFIEEEGGTNNLASVRVRMKENAFVTESEIRYSFSNDYGENQLDFAIDQMTIRSSEEGFVFLSDRSIYCVCPEKGTLSLVTTVDTVLREPILGIPKAIDAENYFTGFSVEKDVVICEVMSSPLTEGETKECYAIYDFDGSLRLALVLSETRMELLDGNGLVLMTEEISNLL